MRKPLNILTIIPLFLGFASITGCTHSLSSPALGNTAAQLIPQGNNGTLEVTLFKGSAKRTTQAVIADISQVVVTVEQMGVNPLSKAIPNTPNEQATAVFDKLITGPATVTVSVLNAQGAVIGYVKNNTVILSDKVSTLSFNIELLPTITNVSTGEGGLQANITIQDGGNYYNFGNVSTLAGDTQGYRDGSGTGALLNNPNGITIDPSGNLLVADTLNNRIRKISPDGVVSTLAGSTQGYLDGTSSAARFSGPTGIVSDANGNVYVTDANGARIRKVTPSGVVSTFAGSGAAGKADGIGTSASFNLPTGLAIDTSGNLYVADTGNHRIRKISTSGVVTTVAGGTAGYLDGQGTEAQLNSPRGVAVDFSGSVYVADTGNNCIRKVHTSGYTVTLAGDTTAGYANGLNARFSQPKGIAIDSSSNLYVADTLNNLVRKVNFDGSVSTIAGQTQSGAQDARGGDAQFNSLGGIAVSPAGKLFVADTLNHRIRTIE